MTKIQAIAQAASDSQNNQAATIYLDSKSRQYHVLNNCGGVGLPEMVNIGYHAVAIEEIAAALERAEDRFFSRARRGRFEAEKL